MKWFLDCKERGLFSSTKQKDWMPAWEYCVEKATEELLRIGNWVWKIEHFQTKFQTEKQRYRALLELLSYTGASFDQDLKIPRVSPEQMANFLRKKNLGKRRFDWIKQPFGDKEIYDKVFFRELAAGTYIEDCEDSEPSHEDVSILRTRSVSIQQAFPKTPSSQLTRVQKRRLETDPDRTPSVSGVEMDEVELVEIQPKRTKLSFEALLSESITKGALALSRPKIAGTDDLERALEDIQERFEGKISIDELICCMEELKKDKQAVLWNSLKSDAIRASFVAKWKNQ